MNNQEKKYRLTDRIEKTRNEKDSRFTGEYYPSNEAIELETKQQQLKNDVTLIRSQIDINKRLIQKINSQLNAEDYKWLSFNRKLFPENKQMLKGYLSDLINTNENLSFNATIVEKQMGDLKKELQLSNKYNGSGDKVSTNLYQGVILDIKIEALSQGVQRLASKLNEDRDAILKCNDEINKAKINIASKGLRKYFMPSVRKNIKDLKREIEKNVLLKETSKISVDLLKNKLNENKIQLATLSHEKEQVVRKIEKEKSTLQVDNNKSKTNKQEYVFGR